MESSQLFMKEAIQLAREGMLTGHGGPFGCVIVKDGVVIGRGFNNVTSGNDPTAHAEIVAIRDACQKLGHFQLDDCDIYCSCEPCPMCLGAIYWARPRKVYFAGTRFDAASAGFDDSFIYNELNLTIPERKIDMQTLDREEALRVFEEWKQLGNKIPY